MKHIFQVVVLMAIGVFWHVYAQDADVFPPSPDYTMVTLDLLPENAEAIARAYLEDFLAKRYPGETIVIGEAIPLYVTSNEIKVLDILCELDGEEPCTLYRAINVYTRTMTSEDAFYSYRDSMEKQNSTHDNIYNNVVFSSFLAAVREQYNIIHIAIAFIDGVPRIVGSNTLRNLLSAYCNLADYKSFKGLGIIPTGKPRMSIAAVLAEGDSYNWESNSAVPIRFINEFLLPNLDPFKWNYFEDAIRFREDIGEPPIAK